MRQFTITLSSSQGPQKATIKDSKGTIVSSKEYAGRKAAIEMLKDEVFLAVMKNKVLG